MEGRGDNGPTPGSSVADGATRSGRVVTFLLTDVEGSTRLWQDRPADAGDLIDRHEEIIREAVIRHGGDHVKRRGEGDSTFNVFESAAAAVQAAMDAQRGLESEPWPEGVHVKVRAALNTGEAEFHAGDYLGTAVNRSARLRSIGHGGQILLSAVTAGLVRDQLPAGAQLRPMGEHRLKDVSHPETVFQLEHPDIPSDFPPLASQQPQRNNLPAQRTPLVGRTAVLDRIRQLLGSSRLLTLTGVGGCGKTRLAIEGAMQAQHHFSDGVLFIDLAAVSDPELVWTALATAATAVTGGFGASSRPVRQDLLKFFEDQQALIVLDNCEHLIDACAELADSVLARCPGISVLATSREAIGIEGEQAFAVPSLDVPADDDAQSESVTLFTARATAADANFLVTDQNLSAIVEICRRLDGIPLAIELAAAQVSHLGPEQIAERLHERFRLLVGTRRRVQRQQTLKAAMDWSYDLLSDQGRQLLRRLAVFPASFDLDAVEAICEPSQGAEAMVGALVARSLVGVVAHSPRVRYRLLETVRIYAEELLTEAGESETYRSRHRDHYLESVLAVPLDPIAIWVNEAAPLAKEFDNLRAAIEWSIGERRFDAVGQIMLRAGGFWNWTGAHEEARRWLDLALDNKDSLDTDQQVQLFGAYDESALSLLEPSRMRSWARDQEWTGSIDAKCSIVLGLFVEAEYQTMQDAASALAIARARLDLAEKELPGSWSGLLLIAVGDALVNLGDLDGALETFRLAAQRGGSGSYPGMWGAMQEALVLHFLGDHAGALRAAEIAWDRRASAGFSLARDSFAEVTMSPPMVLAMAAAGQRAAGEEFLGSLIEQHRRSNVPGAFELLIGTMGCMAAIDEDYERASCLLAAGPMIRAPLAFTIYRHYIQQVRDHLGKETARRYRARGSAMSRDEAITLALRRH